MSENFDDLRPTFNALGYDWDVSLTHYRVKEANKITGLNLYVFIGDRESVTRFIAGELAIEYALAVCRPQAETRGIKIDDLSKAIDSELAKQITDAMHKGVADFLASVQPMTKAAIQEARILVRKGVPIDQA